MKVTAPFNKEQRESINGYQASGVFHPFTCEKCGVDLVAHYGGMACPSHDHAYVQTWCHDFMANGDWRQAQQAIDALKAKVAQTYTIVYADTYDGCSLLTSKTFSSMPEIVDWLCSHGKFPCQVEIFDHSPIRNRYAHDELEEACIQRMEAENKAAEHREYLRLKAIYEPEENKE
jgi:hypothetical protein